MPGKVFVTGCYDLLHSGHVEFFKEASAFGDLYVGIGSDRTIEAYKHHKPMYPEQERLFMVRSIRYVKDAFINSGLGVIDFLQELESVKPDFFVVNEDGDSVQKKEICEERGIEYIVLKRKPSDGLAARSSTDIKNGICGIPTRLDLAGTWIDQPYVSCVHPGWAITVSLEPTFEIRDFCGLSTSTRNVIRSIWPIRLPDMDPEKLARLIFCFENDPEKSRDFISGAQDAIGICIPALSRHYYNGHFWPEKIERCNDPAILGWLESHLCLIPLDPRKPGCSVVRGKVITEEKVTSLASAADDCWDAIMNMDIKAFACAFSASFKAQTEMFPGMVEPVIEGEGNPVRDTSVLPHIVRWSSEPDVLGLKLTGAGGGGYLALVVNDSRIFAEAHPEAITIRIRKI